jgi:hypothetical protein
MKLAKFFICSTGGILLTASLIRFAIASGTSQTLALPEPVLGIPLRYAVLIVGGMEFAAACFCLFSKNKKIQTTIIVWLATNNIVYQALTCIMHQHPQATCLGSLTDPLHLTHSILGIIVSILPIYLLIGSYGLAIWLWRESKKTPPSIKIACPQCGQHIQFTPEWIGQTLPCPQCQTPINLQSQRPI